MTKLKFTLIFILIASFTCSPYKKYRGKITNEYNMPISNVKFLDSKGNIISYSTCNGKFKLNAKKGDTLRLKKTGFKDQIFILNENKKLKFTLFFDYEDIQKTILKEYQKKQREGSGQPIYIVNEEPFFDNELTINENDVQEMKVIKGDLAIKLFGKHAINGVIIISTCPNKN